MSGRLRLPALLLAAAGLAGCAAGAPFGSSGGSAASLPEGSGARGEGSDSDSGAGAILPADPATAAATAALLGTSREQRASGDLAGAAATLERALTIAPDEALLWVELGEIRRAQGDPALAEEMARKALTLTGAGTGLAARARQLIR